MNAPGVSDDKIQVGAILAKTNPIGIDIGGFGDGLKAYLDFVNSQGGVWGRKLELTTELDDQTANNLSVTEELLAQKNVYAVFEAVPLFTGARKLAAAGVPTFGFYLGNPEWAGPTTFFPNIAPQCTSGCPWHPQMWPWVAQQVKAHRVAILGYNVAQSATCKSEVDAFHRFGNKVDAQVVFTDFSLNFGQNDFSPQVAQFKSKNVDFVMACMDLNGDYALAKEMQRAGIADKVTFVHSLMYDHEFVKHNAKALEGGIVSVPIMAFEHEPRIPAVQEYLDYANGHGLKIQEMSAEGWVAGVHFVDALKAAGPHFTWHNLVGALNEQKWDTAQGWVPPVDWTIQHNDPSLGGKYRGQFDCLNFARIHDGKFVPIWDDDGKKPWVCFDGTKPDVWQTPVNLSFAGKPFNLADVTPTAP